jgi:tripartite-type tricarboxylate transporter receptor subunit TctC
MLLFLNIFLALFAAMADIAQAADYPAGPVRAIVPYAPGGGTDIIARQLGARLTERWGYPLVVDNRAGAATVIGTELAARAAPDGYTLLITTGTHAVNATLVKKLPFDPIKSFEPVTLLGTAANVLVVHPSMPAKNVKEFIALAQTRPGSINYSSSGNGGTGHLAMEMLKLAAGVNITHIPYKGAGPAVTALVAGEVATSITNLIAAMPMIKANRMRVLAVTSGKRSVALPNVPTIAESGYAGFDASGWFAVYAPAKTPRAIIGKLAEDFRTVVKLPEVQQGLAAQGAEAAASTPEDLAKWTASEVERWRRVLSASGIKAE